MMKRNHAELRSGRGALSPQLGLKALSFWVLGFFHDWYVDWESYSHVMPFLGDCLDQGMSVDALESFV